MPEWLTSRLYKKMTLHWEKGQEEVLEEGFFNHLSNAKSMPRKDLLQNSE
jgi:hypothetical protein